MNIAKDFQTKLNWQAILKAFIKAIHPKNPLNEMN